MKKLTIISMIGVFFLTISISYALDNTKKIENFSNRNLSVEEKIELSNISELVSVKKIEIYDEIISIETNGCYTKAECDFIENEILEVNQNIESEIIF